MPHRLSSAEFTRLAALYRYGILDTPRDVAFDSVVRDLATVLQVPVVQLVFGDARRLWAKSTVGRAAPDTPRGGMLADLVLADRKRLMIPDLEAEGRIAGDPPPCEHPLRSYAATRIASHEDDSIGLIQVADSRPRAFTTAEAAAIESAGHAISALLESRRRMQLDAETGALTRTAFEDSLRRMGEAMRGTRQRLSVVRFDLAALRVSLESMGTGLGRIALRRMADIGTHQVRRRDCFGRIGYDAFAVLLTDTGEAGARILAERLSGHLLQGWSGTMPSVGSVAVDVASVKPAPGDDCVAVLAGAIDLRVPDTVEQALRRA